MDIYRILMVFDEANRKWPITSFHTTKDGAIKEAKDIGYNIGQQPNANLFAKVEHLIVSVDK